MTKKKEKGPAVSTSVNILLDCMECDQVTVADVQNWLEQVERAGGKPTDVLLQDAYLFIELSR